MTTNNNTQNHTVTAESFDHISIQNCDCCLARGLCINHHDLDAMGMATWVLSTCKGCSNPTTFNRLLKRVQDKLAA